MKGIYSVGVYKLIPYQRSFRALCFFILLALVPFASFSQTGNYKTAYLRNATVRDMKDYAQWLHAEHTDAYIQVLLSFENLPGAAMRSELARNGIVLCDYVSQNTYVAVINTSKAGKTVPAGISGITEMLPEWKIDGQFLKTLTGRQGKVAIIISFLKQVNSNEIEAAIKATGATILHSAVEATGIYYVQIAPDKIKALAAWYGTSYINPVAENVPLDAEANNTQKTNTATLPAVYGGYGLTGNNVTVGVGDNTSGNFHVDIKDRCINYNPAPYNYHGVHTSGIVGAAGIVDVKGQGVAPHATIVNELYTAIWEQTTALHDAHNMTITNNSYAASIGKCDNAGVYNVYSQAVDRMALKHKDVLHVFAAGNDGGLTCSPFPPGFATISGGYQPAKNNLVVASVDKYYQNVKVTGSQGPVTDGRLKPEISAVGADVNSTTKTDEYLVTLGTSMAAPQVAGALALLTERYKQLKGNANPRSDVMKALVMNGATDVGNPGPDFKNGFGALNLGRSLQILDSGHYYTDNITNGAVQQRTIVVPPNTAQLKVMLYWHDEAASPVSANQLVNDLDVEVQAPAGVHTSLILDATPAGVNNPAVEGIDRKNNCEQVVINNPAAGSYILTVKGFSVPSFSQDYVVAYDLIPAGVHITYPTTGAQVKNQDSLFIYWDASDDANGFKIEFSADNGSSWNTIAANVPAQQRYYVWYVPDTINSGLCRMRVSRNSTAQVYATGAFAINSQPVIQLDAVQCPGYIRINWLGIPNTITYEILRKKGPYMVAVDTITGTTYTFSGLSPDSLYYVAVRPILDGLGGYRSVAVRRQPNDGSCAGNISDGDLMAQLIRTPGSGRQFTGSALTNNETLRLIIQNLDDIACNSYKVSYRLDAQPWVSQTFSTVIPATDTLTVNIPGLDLSAPGDHVLKVGIENLSAADPVKVNDTLTKYIASLGNPPIDLSTDYTDDFESMGAFQAVTDSFGFSLGRRWDYAATTDTGRLRSFANAAITIGGNRSISLDAIQNMSGNENDLTGTFNLGAYNTNTDELRFEFDYVLHGRPKFSSGNEVWVRGSDKEAWGRVFVYDTSLIAIGEVHNSGSLSLSDALGKNVQNFSPATQVWISQRDTSVIATREYGNGLTIDNVKLYTVQNDVQLAGILNPLKTECGLIGQVPLTIKVYNSVRQAQNNIGVYYQLDSGSIISEHINFINGKDTAYYTFGQKLNLAQMGQHHLNVWVVNNGDTYHKNDSILNYTIHNQPLISTFPYFENFENNDGYWYSEGQNNSWAYGTPAAKLINKAASGTKAWKTGIDGTYNDLETSYLYSPCFDISKLYVPTLKFKAAIDIENCGAALCDAAYVEWSADGKSWTRLGHAGEGVNWYNDSTYNVWTQENNTSWHDASVNLPKQAATIRMRFVMASDPGLSREGIAIDDVQVYDKNIQGYDNAILSLSPNPTKDGRFTIEWMANPKTEFKLSVADMSGREVYHYTETAADYYSKTFIQTPHFSSGVYLMTIVVGERKFEYKIVYL